MVSIFFFHLKYLGVVCQNLLDCILKSCHLISEIYVANVIDEMNYNADMVYNNRFIWYIVVDVFMKFQMSLQLEMYRFELLLKMFFVLVSLRAWLNTLFCGLLCVCSLLLEAQT